MLERLWWMKLIVHRTLELTISDLLKNLTINIHMVTTEFDLSTIMASLNQLPMLFQ